MPDFDSSYQAFDVEDKAKIQYGFVYEFYGCVFAAFIAGLWLSFILLSKANMGHVYGPMAASLLRWAFGIVEVASLKLKVDRRDDRMWLMSLSRSMGASQDKVNKYSLLQYNRLQILVITLAGITLVLVGALRAHQRWVWLMGATLLVELAVRMIVEVVWRMVGLGGALQVWLKRLDRWVTVVRLHDDGE